MENEKAGGLIEWLRCRTVGLCMAWNRLLNFRIVRSTRPCQFIPCVFVGKNEFRTERSVSHHRQYPAYPCPTHYLNYTQKYFFRHVDLLHLRVEQFPRQTIVLNALLFDSR